MISTTNVNDVHGIANYNWPSSDQQIWRRAENFKIVNEKNEMMSSIYQNDSNVKHSYYLEADLLPRPGVQCGRVRVRVNLPDEDNYWMIDWGIDAADPSAGLWLVDNNDHAYYHLAGNPDPSYSDIYDKDKYITSRFLDFHRVLVHEGQYDSPPLVRKCADGAYYSCDLSILEVYKRAKIKYKGTAPFDLAFVKNHHAFIIRTICSAFGGIKNTTAKKKWLTLRNSIKTLKNSDIQQVEQEYHNKSTKANTTKRKMTSSNDSDNSNDSYDNNDYDYKDGNDYHNPFLDSKASDRNKALPSSKGIEAAATKPPSSGFKDRSTIQPPIKKAKVDVSDTNKLVKRDTKKTQSPFDSSKIKDIESSKLSNKGMTRKLENVHPMLLKGAIPQKPYQPNQETGTFRNVKRTPTFKELLSNPQITGTRNEGNILVDKESNRVKKVKFLDENGGVLSEIKRFDRYDHKWSPSKGDDPTWTPVDLSKIIFGIGYQGPTDDNDEFEGDEEMRNDDSDDDDDDDDIRKIDEVFNDIKNSTMNNDLA